MSKIKRKKTPAVATETRTVELPRYAAIDALRGFAIVLMIAYHFSFDLNYHGLIQQDFNNTPFWLGARAFIVSLFLLLVGISLVLNAQRTDSRSFRRRQLKLFAAACAVSLGSYAMFPDSVIFFGILHFILIASWIGRGLVRFYWANLFAGLFILLFGNLYSNPIFDAAPLQWIGLMTHKPITEDYVPLFPWLGVVLFGLFLGKLIVNNSGWLSGYQGSHLLTRAGRHSLLIYLLHQPVLLGALTLVALF